MLSLAMWVSMANGILMSIIKAEVSNLAGFVLISCTSAIYPAPRNCLSNVFLMMLKFASDSLRRVWWHLWSLFSRRDGSMLCGLFWGSLPGHLLWFSEVPLLEGMCDSDTGGQTSRVVFAHPQILRPELCNHVESWCLWRSCLRVSWFMRNSLAVTVKTESAGDSGLFLWASPLLCAQTDSTHPAHPSPMRPSQREPLQHVVQQVYLFSSLVCSLLRALPLEFISSIKFSGLHYVIFTP